MRAPEFWQSKGLVSTLLTPAAWLWAIGARMRAAKAPRHHANIPVICVGNLSVGGAGKTPIAASLATLLPGAHFLSTGYGGSAKGPLLVDPARHDHRLVGDEPLLLSEIAPCWVAKDRAAGARAAAEAGARCLIMDDGFQDPSLAKDVCFLVVDGQAGFGNERCLPAGPLREPIRDGLKRANAVILLGHDAHHIRERVAPVPVLQAWVEPETEAQILVGRKVVAFAGIGRPNKFFHALDKLGANLVEAYAFPDHYPYHPAEIAELQKSAKQHHAFLVTTGKDSVRVPLGLRDQLAVLEMDVVWEDEAALFGFLPAL